MENKDAKQLSDFTVSAGGVICDEPCWLYSIEVSESNNSMVLIWLVDGHATSGKVKSYIRSGAYVTTPIIYKYPKRFNTGLYIHIASGAGNINGQFLKAD